MSKDDWFRNTNWNAQIEAEFFAKLKRARDKGQYLRIQASCLCKVAPEVTLKLLERYFALGDHFDFAAGYVAQAEAYLTLGELDRAIESYEAALARERAYPNLQTIAYLDLPFTIAILGLEKWYERALIVLDEYPDRLMFPIDFFRWYASKALILSDRGMTSEAIYHAQEAQKRSAVDFSGFPRHPRVGLVSAKYDELIARLHCMAGV